MTCLVFQTHVAWLHPEGKHNLMFQILIKHKSNLVWFLASMFCINRYVLCISVAYNTLFPPYFLFYTSCLCVLKPHFNMMLYTCKAGTCSMLSLHVLLVHLQDCASQILGLNLHQPACILILSCPPKHPTLAVKLWKWSQVCGTCSGVSDSCYWPVCCTLFQLSAACQARIL